MRGILRKFKIQTEKIQSRAGKIFSKWRVLVYSAPVVALLFPMSAHAVSVAGVKKLGGAALSKTGSVAGLALSNLLQGSVEGAAMMAVWITILYQLTKIFADLFSGIFLFLINFLIGVSQYNSFLGAPIVTIGWSVTRDIANMFLVVALLVIAFATILNVNSYQASSLLKQFFFSAILVNFSKMICGVFIDASQVVMMTFVSGFSETAAGNFVKLFQVDKWLQLGLGTSGEATTTQNALGKAADTVSTWTSDFFTGIATNIFTAIISFFGMLAILSLDIVLVVRVITLWFLIIAAPIAFVAKVLPVTKGFSGQWWSIFTKQLIAGPLVAFIVWSSLASIAVSEDAFDLTKDARNKDKLFAEANATQSTQSQLAATKISQWENLALYLVPLMIFIMGAKWSVSVAGGAAKSITGAVNGKLSGMAMSGVRMFQKQAIGKGQFSAMTQAKKGFSGEGGMATLGMGAVGGFALSKIGGKRGEALSGKIGNVLGDRGRAKTREFHKDVKVAASKVGLGDLGHKRHEVHNADADAKMYRERAALQLAQDNAAAAQIADPAAREAAEEEAQSRYAVLQKKADDAIHHAEDSQKKIFEADGLTDDRALLAEMKKRVEHGHHVSEVELATAKKIISEAADKKVAAKIVEERQKWAAKKKAHVDAGKDPDDFPKFDENTVRGDAENEFGIRKKNPDDPNNPGIEDLYKRYKESPPIDITANSNKTPTRVAAEAARDAGRTAATNLSTAHVQVANTFTTEMNVAADEPELAAAKTKLARTAGANLGAAAAAQATPNDLKASAHKAINLVPPPERAAFVREATAASNNDASVIAALNSAQADIARLAAEAAAAQAAMEARYTARREDKPNETILYTLKDVGAIRDPGGNLTMTPEAISRLEAVIRSNPAFAGNLGPEVLSQSDIKRMVGHAITSVADINAFESGIRRNNPKPEVVIRMKNAFATSVKNTNSDPTLRAYADTMFSP